MTEVRHTISYKQIGAFSAQSQMFVRYTLKALAVLLSVCGFEAAQHLDGGDNLYSAMASEPEKVLGVCFSGRLLG